jgi:hypothetical protein
MHRYGNALASFTEDDSTPLPLSFWVSCSIMRCRYLIDYDTPYFCRGCSLLGSTSEEIANHCALSCTGSRGSNGRPTERKSHFTVGKCSRRVRFEEPADSKSSSLKYRPVLPRPWQRIAVNLCFEVGSTIVGSIVDHNRPSMFGRGPSDITSIARARTWAVLLLIDNQKSRVEPCVMLMAWHLGGTSATANKLKVARENCSRELARDILDCRQSFGILKKTAQDGYSKALPPDLPWSE